MDSSRLRIEVPPPVIEEWSRRVIVEFHSAQITAQMHLLLKGVPCSQRLLNLCERVISDELRHSKDCLENLQHWGVEVPIVVEQIQLAQELPRLQSPLKTLLCNFVIGETAAVRLFGHMLINASEPHAIRVLRAIVRDEKVHSAFAWQVLDELLEKEEVDVSSFVPNGEFEHPFRNVRECIQMNLSTWVLQMYRRIEMGHHQSALSDLAISYGLIDGQVYQEIWTQCFIDEIGPKLRERGLEPPML